MSSFTVYVGNTNLLEIFRLKSAIDNSYINDATVTVTVKDSLGVEVTGQSWPTAVDYVSGSDGDYYCILDENLDLTAGESYIAEIDADGGVNRFGHWEVTFVPIIRNR